MGHKEPLMVTLTDVQFGKPIHVDIESIKKKTQQNYASASKALAHSSFVTTLHMKDGRKIRVVGSTEEVDAAIEGALARSKVPVPGAEPAGRMAAEGLTIADKPTPKAGDALILPSDRVKIHLVSEGVVDISPDRNVSPVPVEHFAPSGEPNTWVLVGISSTDDLLTVKSRRTMMAEKSGMMPLKEGQQVIVKTHGGTLVGTVMFARPEEVGVAEEDRLYKVHIDDTCVCRNADLEVVSEPADLKAEIMKGSVELQDMQDALELWLINNNDEVARERFLESGRKLGIIKPLPKTFAGK